MKRTPLTARVTILQNGALLRLRSAEAPQGLTLVRLHFVLVPFGDYQLDMLQDLAGPVPNLCEIRRPVPGGLELIEHEIPSREGVGLLTKNLRLDRGQFFLAEFQLHTPMPRAYGYAAFMATVPA